MLSKKVRLRLKRCASSGDDVIDSVSVDSGEMDEVGMSAHGAPLYCGEAVML